MNLPAPSALFFLLSASPLLAVPAYEIHVGNLDTSWRSEIRFSDKLFPSVPFTWDGDDTFPYQPNFSKSPDGRWILCVVKTGSGENASTLYQVDDAGRVFGMITRLDHAAWKFSDRVSEIPFARLYHTGIRNPNWTDSQTLTFTLRGSDSEKSGSGVSLVLEYDLAKGTFSRR